jgi:hypothetical protein
MTQIDAAGQAEKAHTRLTYFIDLSEWLGLYLKRIDTAKADTLPIDSNLEGACRALMERLSRAILKDAVEAAQYDLNGKPVWEKPEF